MSLRVTPKGIPGGDAKPRAQAGPLLPTTYFLKGFEGEIQELEIPYVTPTYPLWKFYIQTTYKNYSIQNP